GVCWAMISFTFDMALGVMLRGNFLPVSTPGVVVVAILYLLGNLGLQVSITEGFAVPERFSGRSRGLPLSTSFRCWARPQVAILDNPMPPRFLPRKKPLWD